MTVDAKVFLDKIQSLLDHLYESQKDVIEETAQLMARCIENDGVVHVFGSGHSVGLAIDISLREGSLVPVHIIENADAVILGEFTLEEFTDKVNKFERRQGVAQYFYNLYDIRENELTRDEDGYYFDIDFGTFTMYYYVAACRWSNGNTAEYAFALERSAA